MMRSPFILLRTSVKVNRRGANRRLGEKSAERYALRAADFMSELKLRPPEWFLLAFESRAAVRGLGAKMMRT
jgi:hypothetical protein